MYNTHSNFFMADFTSKLKILYIFAEVNEKPKSLILQQSNDSFVPNHRTVTRFSNQN